MRASRTVSGNHQWKRQSDIIFLRMPRNDSLHFFPGTTELLEIFVLKYIELVQIPKILYSESWNCLNVIISVELMIKDIRHYLVITYARVRRH
jgi:hypothetical protein